MFADQFTECLAYEIDPQKAGELSYTLLIGSDGAAWRDGFLGIATGPLIRLKEAHPTNRPGHLSAMLAIAALTAFSRPRDSRSNSVASPRKAAQRSDVEDQSSQVQGNITRTRGPK